MPTIRPASQVLDEEFLTLRAKLLEIAAGLDRLDRAPGSASFDSRRGLIEKSLTMIQSDSGDRAERLQLLFSRDYDPEWRSNMSLEVTKEG